MLIARRLGGPYWALRIRAKGSCLISSSTTVMTRSRRSLSISGTSLSCSRTRPHRRAMTSGVGTFGDRRRCEWPRAAAARVQGVGACELYHHGDSQSVLDQPAADRLSSPIVRPPGAGPSKSPCKRLGSEFACPLMTIESRRVTRCMLRPRRSVPSFQTLRRPTGSLV